MQTSEFTALAEGLDGAPFSDLLQAAFYIPWALMQNNDFPAAIEMRKAFNVSGKYGYECSLGMY